MNQCKDKIVTYFLKIFSASDEFILINLIGKIGRKK